MYRLWRQKWSYKFNNKKVSICGFYKGLQVNKVYLMYESSLYWSCMFIKINGHGSEYGFYKLLDKLLEQFIFKNCFINEFISSWIYEVLSSSIDYTGAIVHDLLVGKTWVPCSCITSPLLRFETSTWWYQVKDWGGK